MFIDVLFIKKLVIMATVGIHDWEKKCFQKLYLDIQLAYNRNELIKDDKEIISYLDYTQVKKIIYDVIDHKEFCLIEDIAELVAKVLIHEFCVRWVRIKVSKFGAIRDASDVGICITRKSNKKKR